MKENYTVYTHRLPNGKIYVGYLNLSGNFANGRTFDEIMNSGRYHEKRTSLYEDIQNYGWEQVQTETISGLTKDQATLKKQELCLEYQSYSPQFGYNRYADAGLPQPPKVDKTPKGKLAKKIVSMFLHGDFSIYDYLLKQFEFYSDEVIVAMFDIIKNEAGYIALSLTRKRFETSYSEAQYLLKVLDDPHCINRQIA